MSKKIKREIAIGDLGIPLLKGDRGYGVSSIARTSGDGSAGTTDTYTVYIDTTPETAIGTFTVLNGQAGDMKKSVYDANNDGIVDKATADASGITIPSTYETISNVSAISDRVTTLEEAGFVTDEVNDLQYYYTKNDIDNAGFITSSVNDLTYYYTKTEIDNSGFITNAVDDLTNYYTKTEIDTLVGDIETLLASI